MACSENGIDISKQASRQLIYEELGAADSIFVMEAYQKEYIQTFVPQAAGRLFLLGAWPGKERTNAVIEDPIGKRFPAYRKSFELIARQVDRILPFLLAEST